MQTKQKVFYGFAVLVVTALIALAGCAATQTRTERAPDEVGNAAVDEATSATKDNVRQGVRDGVNDAFKSILKK